MSKSRNEVDGKIHVIRKGLAVYKVRASPFYRVRIWVPSEHRYIVKSTKEISRIFGHRFGRRVFRRTEAEQVCRYDSESRACFPHLLTY